MASKPDMEMLYLVPWAVQHHTTDLHIDHSLNMSSDHREREREIYIKTQKDHLRPHWIHWYQNITTTLQHELTIIASWSTTDCFVSTYLDEVPRWCTQCGHCGCWAVLLNSYSCFVVSFSSQYCRLLATGSRPTQRLRHQQLPQIYRIAASSATFKASGMLDSVGSCCFHQCLASQDMKDGN